MSAQNDNMLVVLAQQGYPAPVDIISGSTATPTGPTLQSAALPIPSQVVRVLTGVSNMALVLPDVQLGTSDQMCFVLNESANSIVVFPAVNATGNPVQQMDGVNNGSRTIASGACGVFVQYDQRRVGKGGGVVTPSPGWRSAVLA